MRFSSIASGSSGNCIYVNSEDTHILVDTGISKKRIEDGLNLNDVSGRDVSAILITHEHSDHISSLGVMSRAYNVPVYLTKGTYEEIKKINSLGKIDYSLFNIIEEDRPFLIGNIKIKPFKISHDAKQPVAYRFEDATSSFAVATDMGGFDDYIIDNLKNLNSILIESNHDVNMLMAGSYPYMLKQRILGIKGHLSNEACASLLAQIINDKMNHIYLGHLSSENNYEELAYETTRTEIDYNCSKYKASDFDIKIAKKNLSLAAVEV